jgi:hypothetical protein
MKSGVVNAVLYEWGEHVSIHTLQIQCPIWVEFGLWDLRAEVIPIGNCESIFWGKTKRAWRKTPNVPVRVT